MNASNKTLAKIASTVACASLLAFGSGCAALDSAGTAYQPQPYYGTAPVIVDSVGQKQMFEIMRLRQQYDMMRR